MIDLYLDPTTNDLVVENFSFKVTTRKEDEIIQRLRMKLLWWKGEWIFNENYGIDYPNQVMKKGISLQDIDDLFRVQISQEEGVVSLISYKSEADYVNRILKITAKIQTESGEIITLSFNL